MSPAFPTRPTVRDVARRSGVSIATVSYVLNDRADKPISAETRTRVLTAAAELGYVANSAAAALRRGHSGVVLLVTDATFTGEVSARTVESLTAGISRVGHIVIVHSKVTEDELLDVVHAIQPLAVLLLTTVSPAGYASLTTSGTRHVLGLPAASTTGGATDRFWERDIGAAQIRHLHERGHQQIAYALPEPTSPRHPVAVSRLAGARQECHDQDLPDLREVTFPLDRDRIAERLPALRASGVTAICAHDDRMAMAVLAALTDLGWSTPNDLAIIGADNDTESRLTIPALSTAWLPDADDSAHATELLTAALAGHTHDMASVLRTALPAAEVLARHTT